MKISKLQIILAVALTLTAFGVRVYRLDIPHEWVFDEVYHALSAEMYALNDPRGYEWWHISPEGLAYEWLHPPIEKLLMAGSIKVFSHPFVPLSKLNPPLDASTTFAWRFPSAVCASLTVLVIILMGTRMFNFPVGFLAGLFYAIDPLSFVQGRLGTSDAIFTFFSTLAFYQLYIFLADYPKKYIQNILLLGLGVGLAFSTKFTGVFTIFWSGFFILALFIYRRYFVKVKKRKIDYSLDRLFLTLAIFALTIINVYLFSHLQWWLQGHTWQEFYELHNQIIRYHIGLKATHPFSSPPLSWPIMQKPVWIYMGQDEFGKSLNIWATGNRVTWYAGLASVVFFTTSLFVRLGKAIHTKKLAKFFTPDNVKLIFLLTLYFGMFLPWLLSPRILFIYHYLPALPFLFLLLAKAIHTAINYLRLLGRVRTT